MTKERKAFFRSFCSGQVVDTLFYNKDFTWETKMKILDKSKKIAKEYGRSRVYVSDWEEAKRKIK